MIKNKGERLTTLGFGIPNLLKFGNVGYFPEQFIVDFGLQGKTASDIQRYFMSTGMAFDGEEENKERIAKLEKELKYYQEIIILKDVDCYYEGVIGGEIIMIGSWLVGTGIELGIRKLRK